MTSRLTRIQLVVFVVVTVVSIWYGSVRFLDVGSVFRPPYTISAEFATAGGIYPRADVEVLGTRVGSVREIKPGPGSGTTVVLAIDKGVSIPEDVRASIGNKSAIGEQYVELKPLSTDGDKLAEGDVIPLARTHSPVEIAQLLSHLDGLAKSVPTDDLATVLDEVSKGVTGLGPTMGRLLADSDRFTRTSLTHVDELTALIEDASTVLDTQVAMGPQTTRYLRELGSLTARLRQLVPAFDELFADGIRAGAEVVNLLSDNQKALPVLLNNLVSLTHVASDRIPAVRKTLVMFPWAIELGATSIRPCDEYDPRTGKPIESTCHYDEDGNPVFSAHLAFQLSEQPGKSPYLPCVKGYEDTRRYQPDGDSLDGGSRQPEDSKPNMQARCTAPPTDPTSPNVRGSQNVPSGSDGAGRAAPPWGLALFDPNTGTVAAPDGVTYRISGTTGAAPPPGDAGLDWLLTHQLGK